MMSLAFGLFTQVSDSGPLRPSCLYSVMVLVVQSNLSLGSYLFRLLGYHMSLQGLSRKGNVKLCEKIYSEIFLKGSPQ